MRIKESDCVDCGLPCSYEACPHYEVTYYVCDECGDATELFHFEGQELCTNCILSRLEPIEGS